MKVGLVDVDGHKFPNLALMKLSAWHKANGDEVEMCFPLARYDRIYASKVFSFTPDISTELMADDIRKGGTGYGVRQDDRLPDEIEHTRPDYSLYGITDTAYGFMSRGCPRGCPFCIVADKEGRASRKVADLREFWNGERNIQLLDPNTLACPDWREILGQLAESGAWVDINQGADIRLMTAEKAEMLNRIKLKNIHFAWDNPKDDLREKFLAYASIARRKFASAFGTVYVLCNYNSTMDENLYRIYTLRDMGFDPYVMIYDKQHAPREIIRLQRWVNAKWCFKKCKRFEDYKG